VWITNHCLAMFSVARRPARPAAAARSPPRQLDDQRDQKPDARSTTAMKTEMIDTVTTTTTVDSRSSSRLGQVTLVASTGRPSGIPSPVQHQRSHGAGVLLQNRQYFLCSSRSGCLRLFVML